jgi:hypothetical protein
MLLGSFQHDLGNTLASLQTALVRAWTRGAGEGRKRAPMPTLPSCIGPFSW